jgi:hypothetical protein
MMMTAGPELDARIREFTTGALAALTDERYAECVLLSDLECGLRLRPCEDDPNIVELLWAGAVIGMTTWTWLNTGELPAAVSPGAYDEH